MTNQMCIRDRNLSAAMTDDGNSLIEMLFDVFEKDLIDMLELSDATRKAIEGVDVYKRQVVYLLLRGGGVCAQ